MILKLENIYKTYISEGEEIHVLNGIDLEIKENQILSVEGASGSGKSTLLNIIGVIDQPNSGNVYLFNEKVDFSNAKTLDRIRTKYIGFIFQHYYLLPDFTVLENVMMPAWIVEKQNNHKHKEDFLKKAKELLEKVGMSHRKNHFPSQISGGEMARTSIARALMGGKKIILADEPTGNLDKENSKKIIELLWQLHEEFQFTLIIVTHDTELTQKIPLRYKLLNGKLELLSKKL
ncbi:MAG: ABC transporter ATP-binding protein [Leptonema sp. (in: bacteria)]